MSGNEMMSPEPEFWIIFVVPFSVEDEGFRVEAVFTAESDAVAHAQALTESKNYLCVSGPNKELMSSVLDRLLHQKIRCLATIGTKEVVLKL